MKKLLKILVGLAALAIVGVAGLIAYVRFVLPRVGPAPDMKVELTPERIARGEYLANSVTVCIDCHSKRDWSRFSGPPIDGTFGMGGDVFDKNLGFPGTYYAPNITPEGVGNYTDGELFRAITTGVNKEGEALFPVMPYHYYGRMDEEDIKSIIAYVRTLKPIKNEVPRSVSDFPMNFIINTIPQKAELTQLPPATDTLAYGKYLTNAAGCVECHTRANKGMLVAGMEFGGGREFRFPEGYSIRSSNISPDKETGIGSWDGDTFVKTFRMRSDPAIGASILETAKYNTIMPWTMYGKMTDDDLRAIFAYLKTVKPIKSKVQPFPMPPAERAQR